jgi:NAD(P)-dependent dehydrogenase (short-subunit alcohol dehydrogenase family)
MSGRLNGKIAIVTGAGSRGPGLGNGKATAILFAREGAKVFCVDQMKERAEETVAAIRAESGEAAAHAADVTRAAECAAMVKAAVDLWGGVDILHNNVGIESRKGLLDTTEAEWDRVIAVDLKSMFLATQATVPAMARRGGGAVICVSSIAGLRGYGRTAYATAKAGVIGFVRSVAVQLGPKGIRVNAIAPGFFESEMTDAYQPGYIESLKPRVLLGRMGDPVELAATLVWLASDAGGFVTGQTIVVDGGVTIT